MAKAKSKIASGGNGSGNNQSSFVSIKSVTQSLNAYKAALGAGNAPSTINVKGVNMFLSAQSNYVSGGGFIVYSYEYRSDSPISRDGRDGISFLATNYNAPNGAKVSNYARRGTNIFRVAKIGRTNFAGSPSRGQ